MDEKGVIQQIKDLIKYETECYKKMKKEKHWIEYDKEWYDGGQAAYGVVLDLIKDAERKK